MDVSEVKTERFILEERIKAFVFQEMQGFKEKTGVGVKSLTVSIGSSREYGDQDVLFYITGVTCELDI